MGPPSGFWYWFWWSWWWFWWSWRWFLLSSLSNGFAITFATITKPPPGPPEPPPGPPKPVPEPTRGLATRGLVPSNYFLLDLEKLFLQLDSMENLNVKKTTYFRTREN